MTRPHGAHATSAPETTALSLGKCYKQRAIYHVRRTRRYTMSHFFLSLFFPLAPARHFHFHSLFCFVFSLVFLNPRWALQFSFYYSVFECFRCCCSWCIVNCYVTFRMMCANSATYAQATKQHNRLIKIVKCSGTTDRNVTKSCAAQPAIEFFRVFFLPFEWPNSLVGKLDATNGENAVRYAKEDMRFDRVKLQLFVPRL